MKKAVVLMPAYNVEKYVTKTLQSLLDQTCNCFDILIVDDGSKDKTVEVIESYKKSFKDKDIKLTIIKKENGGAASAINVGLKQKLDYEYILIMDSDDWLSLDGIESRVKFLDENKDYGAVIGHAMFVDEETGEEYRLHKNGGITDNKEETFKNILLTKDVIYSSFMFRLKELLEVLTDGQIFESQGGQNWQLLLPFSYKYKIKVLEDTYLYYLIRQTSHSHCTEGSYKKIKQRENIQKELVEETLKRMGKSEYNYDFENRYYTRLAYQAFRYKQKSDFMMCYEELKKRKIARFKDFVKKWYLKILVKG